MAYCEKCGAYVPDGQFKCLACGYDATAAAREEQKRAAAAAYQQEKRAEEERRREEQTRAEEARRRKMDEDRRWAEKEYARRRAERIQNERSRWESSDFGGTSVSENTGFHRTSGGNKALGILSYFSFLFILPLIFAGDDKFCRFHARQGLALFVFGAIASALSSTPFGWIMQIMRIYMIVKGVISAANERCEPLPFIGKYVGK